MTTLERLSARVLSVVACQLVAPCESPLASFPRAFVGLFTYHGEEEEGKKLINKVEAERRTRFRHDPARRLLNRDLGGVPSTEFRQKIFFHPLHYIIFHSTFPELNWEKLNSTFVYTLFDRGYNDTLPSFAIAVVVVKENYVSLNSFRDGNCAVEREREGKSQSKHFISILNHFSMPFPSLIPLILSDVGRR